MRNVDKIIFDALRADEDLMRAVGCHIVSTCFEVSPTEADNTPLPNIIVTDDGFQNQQTSKDNVWEACEDRVQVGVDVAAKSPREVQHLIRVCRKAISRYVIQLYNEGEEIPELDALTSDGLAWDWMKPCYHQALTYSCTTNALD